MAAIPERVGDLKEELIGDVLIVRLRGRLDAVSSPKTEKTICEALEMGQNKVLLDMSGVAYVSSAGLRMLLSTTKRLRTFAGTLAVCAITPDVLDILKISGFDHALTLFETEDDALKHL